MAKDLPVEDPLVCRQRVARRIGGHPCQSQPVGTPELVEKHQEAPVARAGGS
jgi:hypothetical protein